MRPRLELTATMGAGLSVPSLLLRMALAEIGVGRLDDARGRCEALISTLEGRNHYTGGWALVLLAEVWRLLDGEAAAAGGRPARQSKPAKLWGIACSPPRGG